MTPTSDEPSRDDEGMLVMLARGGDHDAFDELVRRHQRRLWHVCRQYLGPADADGAVQRSLIKAYTALGSFDGRAAFSTWTTRIAINTCLDELRRRRRAGQWVDEATDDDGDGEDRLARMPDDGADPEERTMQRQAVARLARAEHGLSERQREIFRLRFYAELELDEIAGALGVHVGTVKTQLHRAVHRLRRELGDVR